MSGDTPISSQHTDELLQRILKAVEPATRRRGLEIACAVLLSLATTASAWCEYQELAVLFASVLFFGGIARSFDNRALRQTLAVVAILLFLGTLTGLISMPLCHE